MTRIIINALMFVTLVLVSSKAYAVDLYAGRTTCLDGYVPVSPNGEIMPVTEAICLEHMAAAHNCADGNIPLSSNEFARWRPSGCMETFKHFVKVENRTEECIVPSWQGYTDQPLVVSLETREDGLKHRVSTAIHTADGIQACQPACSSTYVYQDDVSAVMTATGYTLPIGQLPRKIAINGARMHLFAATRYNASRGTKVIRIESPVWFDTDLNNINTPTGRVITFSRSGDCPNWR